MNSLYKIYEDIRVKPKSPKPQDSVDIKKIESFFKEVRSYSPSRNGDETKHLSICYESLANQNTEVQTDLGDCYLIGNGTKADYNKAYKCYKSASRRGSIASKYRLGECYSLGICKKDIKPNLSYDGYGMSKVNRQVYNKTHAMKYFYDAAKNGHSKSARKLADCIYDTMQNSNSFAEIPEKGKNTFINAIKVAESLHFPSAKVGWRPFIVEYLPLYLPSKLRSLDLHKNSLGDEGIARLATTFPETLTTLRLSHNYIGVVGAKILAKYLPVMLKELDLSWNNIEKRGIEALAPNLPVTLTALNLSWNNIGRYGAEILAKNLPKNLLSLSLYLNNIGYSGIQAIAQCLSTNLQTLDVHNNNIGNNGVEALALHLPKTLRSLNLSSHLLAFRKIEDRGIRALATRLPMLQLLDLSYNNIGSKGLKVLARYLPKTLRSLNLRSNKIGDSGTKSLAHHLPKGLLSLNLSSNRIRASGAKMLARYLPGELQILKINSNKIGGAGVKTLVQHLPVMLQLFDARYNDIEDSIRVLLRKSCNYRKDVVYQV